jgi:hypothetical protein
MFRNRFRTGAKDYSIGGHPVWQICRAVYQVTKRPYVVGALMMLAGYLSASIRRIERPVSREFVEFHRREQMRRLQTFFGGWSAALTPVRGTAASAETSRGAMDRVRGLEPIASAPRQAVGHTASAAFNRR